MEATKRKQKYVYSTITPLLRILRRFLWLLINKTNNICMLICSFIGRGGGNTGVILALINTNSLSSIPELSSENPRRYWNIALLLKSALMNQKV